ncbi:Thioesterase-like superfamily protein [Streptomyces sp. DvalAA-14]|uniref:thioesterase family protein n=1 Tax=unclassified Streptomyces TaxID=2593676 RepID=UPI00081B6FDE|nr:MULTISPECIES: thioesterase family protein [unclassified Streptomyces]MYS20277.1 thioesterase family protein [Streptomyces sp. SID4948]SCD65236.1 Thioesterase-like superfamily protein [Streptomyces sp. DvalAA-14]
MATAPARAAIGDSEFDRDTAVVPRPGEPGTYDIDLSPGWTIISALNGGYLLAVLGRALGDALPHHDPLTITAHYLTASQPGPAVVRTQTVRVGRTLSTGQASLFQRDADGREVERIRVLAGYGDLDALPDDVRTTATPPPMASYADSVSSDDAPGGSPVPGSVAILDRLDLRLDPATAGWAVGAPSGAGRMRGWLGLADGRDHDALSVLLAVDALPATAFDLGFKGWTPTVELTVHVRCRPAPGPLRVSLVTRNLAGGLLEEDGEVWDSAGRLVAQSRQLARAPRG